METIIVILIIPNHVCWSLGKNLFFIAVGATEATRHFFRSFILHSRLLSLFFVSHITLQNNNEYSIVIKI
jgi:hypothetical protein